MLALAALLLSAWPALTHPQNELLLVDLDASPSPAFALDSFPLVNGESARGVLFSAEQSEIGREPWWTDGTPQGTWTAGDLRPGPAGSDAGPALRLPDGRFLLPLWSDGYGVEPHVLDPA
jgi:ELWxxDGT repeat protein